MTIQKVSNTEIQTFIAHHSNWQIKNQKLSKTFVFKDFSAAFKFMTAVALVAEQNQHHPEWFNCYKTVTVQLTTHTANGITQQDFKLANTMDVIAKKPM
jgi:4a-hydroxytetrahydrobiopterin dehydratase